MARRRQLRLTQAGFYYLLVLSSILVGATFRQLNLLILLATILAGPLAFSMVYGRWMLRRFRIERRLPQQLRADQRLTVDVRVTNRRRWFRIWSIAVEDQVVRQDDRDAAPARVGVFFATIRAGQTQHTTYNGRLPRRGRYRFGPLRVSTRFPLGLVRHRLVVEDLQTLIVHPKLGRLTHDWTEVARRSAAGGQSVLRRGSLEAEYYGLRDWRSGDSRRWIHWRSSARRGSLVVRQFEEQRSRDVALLVDLWQPATPSDEQIDRVERALSFVATLIDAACRQPGRRFFLSFAAATFLERSGPASPLFFQQQMDDLALVAPHHDPGFPTSLGHALARVPASIPTLLVSTRPIDWEALASAAAARDVPLAGRHLQTVDVSGEELSRYFQE